MRGNQLRTCKWIIRRVGDHETLSKQLDVQIHNLTSTNIAFLAVSLRVKQVGRQLSSK